MAQLPPYKRMQIEAYSDTPAWFQKFLVQLNGYLEPTYNNFLNGISVAQNINARLETIKITAGALHTDNVAVIADNRQPVGVTIFKVTNTANVYTPPAGAVTCSWVASGGNIRITSITGLTPGEVYQVTFWMTF